MRNTRGFYTTNNLIIELTAVTDLDIVADINIGKFYAK